MLLDTPSQPETAMPPSKRDELIDAAMRVFHRNGFHSSGLDLILQEGGVSRMTLYNHFKSKDDLIVAALERRDEIFAAQMMEFVEKVGADPRERILAVFDFHESWFNQDDYCGCMFINASSEFADPASGARKVAARTKRALITYLAGLCRDAGIDNPEQVAEQLNLLLEGAIVTAKILGQSDEDPDDTSAIARLARSTAEGILGAAAPVH